ncbi:MAG: DUF1329 domain-containing protein [Nevskiaceae bacterium]|nr:MAG: DUF1329 domain-containing protein [Nevskiaceae bacterium]TBR72098.1 MAG: DUF1329 domain-containing protein [Nevskiaceae bacterium]
MTAPGTPQASVQQTPQQMLAAAKTGYERALLLRDLAARAVAGKDYVKAVAYLQQALAQNALSAPAQALMQQQLTALLTASGDPAQVIKALEPAYRKGGALAPGQQAALGAAYVRQKRYADGLPLLEKAVAAQPAPTPVAWLEALAAAQLGIGHVAQAEPTLQRVVAAAPDAPQGWLQLAAVQVKLDQAPQALATLELAARLGYLATSAQRLELVGVASRAGLPYRAAAILQTDLQAGRVDATHQNWQWLAVLWTQARERALAIAAWRRAIALGGGAALNAQIGALALQQQDYATAATAFAAAGATPALRLNLGIAQFHAGDVQAARAAFTQAAQGGGKVGTQAGQWLAFVQAAGARQSADNAAHRSLPQLAALQPRDPLAGAAIKLSAAQRPVVVSGTVAAIPAPSAPQAASSTAALDLRRYTPVGAERAGSADGAVPAWVGGLTRAHWPAGWQPGQRLVDPFAADQPLFTVTAENVARYAKYLSPGQQALFRKFPDYRMVVYPARRTVAYPQAIYDATQANIGRAKLLGPDALSGARLGFPFPRPANGVEVMWNHRVRYRGGSSQQQSAQAVVFADGRRVMLRQTELVYSRYANLKDPVDIDRDNILLDYLTWFERPTGGFDFAALVHETANSQRSQRAVWVLPPKLGRMFRVPPVGYDQPFPGSGGLYFLDMVDMYNGPFDRYVWKLVGKRELLIPYNAYRLASGRDSYDALLTPHHFNQDAVRYEMHRVWQIDATLRGGAHHAFGRRVFYVDEDSWNVVLVDNYDPSGQLWRIQEGHLLPLYGVQAAVCEPVVTYDLKGSSYFVNHLIGHEPPGRFGLKGLSERQFQPAVVQARFGR